LYITGDSTVLPYQAFDGSDYRGTTVIQPVQRWKLCVSMDAE